MARAESAIRRAALVPRPDPVGRRRHDPRLRDCRPRTAVLHDSSGPSAVLQGRAYRVFRRDVVRPIAAAWLVARPAEEDALLLEPGGQGGAALLELRVALSGAGATPGPT